MNVITAGLHGSASTFVFNVARELLIAAYGADAVHPCHATGPGDVQADRLPGGKHVIAKSHGWPGIAAFAQAWPAAVIVTVRDPRDAVLSMMQRFGEPLERSVRAVTQDAMAARACAAAGFAMLRYEERFFDAPDSAARIGAMLGLDLPAATCAGIAARYRTDAMRLLSSQVCELPPDRRGGQGGFAFDLETQITNRHIGDGRTGKWREVFDARTRAALTRHFGPFLAAFGYAPGQP